MKILSVELENYGAFYGKHLLELADKGLTLVLGENRDEPKMSSNGGGKSTTFDGLDWTLFGDIPKGDHVDSIINDECKEARGVVRLVDDDRGLNLTVERAKARGKAATLQFWVGDTHYQSLDTAETQRLLERELGLDRDVFHATVLFAQTDTLHFADATEARRMEILAKILPELASIDGWAEKAKARSRVLEAAVRDGEGRVEAAKGLIAGLDASIETAKRMAGGWAAQHAQELETMIRAGRELAQVVETWKVQLAGEAVARKAVADLEAAAPTVDFGPATAMDAAITAAQAEAQQWYQKATNAQAGVIQIDRQLTKYREAITKGVCAMCGQRIAGPHAAEEMEKLAAQREPLAQEAIAAKITQDFMEAKAAGLRADQAKLRGEAEQVYKAHVQRVGEARQTLIPFDNARRILDAREAELKQARENYARASVATNPHEGQTAALDAQRLDAQRKLSEVSTGMEATVQERRYADFWVDAFGLKGLKSYVLDARLQEMTDAANTWVKMLTGGTIWVRFETQKMGRSTKRLSNDINIRVFRYNPNGTTTERNYRSWSGGEKKRVSWAIDFGLSRLVAARATKRYDLLVLDEVFKYVDSAGGEAVIEMLNHLRQERSSIFVIEHDGAFQSQFENKLTVRKLGGRSTILTEAQRGQETQQESQGHAHAISEAIGAPVAAEAQPKRKKARRGVPAGAPSGSR